jgi:hypothetical protein
MVQTRKIQKIRRPVKERMLRSAGTSLRQRLEDLNEQCAWAFISCAVVPIVIALAVVLQVSFTQPVPLGRAMAGGILALIPALPLAWHLRKLARKVSDHNLGLSGELAVSEHLQELARAGCYIFHDLQPEKTWNIDHIVVAPESVLVIETKTRRMRESGGAQPAHEVIFDGSQLHFPQWSDAHGLAQAERNAGWVRDYLAKALSEVVKVEAVLTLPGWMVRRRGRGKVCVVNPKEMPALVRTRGAHHIRPDQQKRMRQIAFALEQKCRDVEF